MQVKDTLTLYEELVATGVPDDQAKIQAHQLGGIASMLSTSIDEFKQSMDSFKSEIRSDYKWIMRIGGFISITLIGMIVKVVFNL